MGFLGFPPRKKGVMALPKLYTTKTQQDVAEHWAKVMDKALYEQLRGTHRDLQPNELEGLRLERIVHEKADYDNADKIAFVFFDRQTGRRWYQAIIVQRDAAGVRGIAETLKMIAAKLVDEWNKAESKREQLTPTEKRKKKEREYYEERRKRPFYAFDEAV